MSYEGTSGTPSPSLRLHGYPHNPGDRGSDREQPTIIFVFATAPRKAAATLLGCQGMQVSYLARPMNPIPAWRVASHVTIIIIGGGGQPRRELASCRRV